jgi:hypothetical protein
MRASTRPSLKRQVLELLDQLPDNCTVEDMHYQLYLIDKINRGEESLRRRGGITQAQVRRQLASCLTK